MVEMIEVHESPSFIDDCIESIRAIQGRSFRVCQECYDRRCGRHTLYADKIVKKDECTLCNMRYMRKKEVLKNEHGSI